MKDVQSENFPFSMIYNEKDFTGNCAKTGSDIRKSMLSWHKDVTHWKKGIDYVLRLTRIMY